MAERGSTTRGLVVAALLSVASFSGAEKSTTRISKKPVVNNIELRPEWSHTQKKSCKLLQGVGSRNSSRKDPKYGNRQWIADKENIDGNIGKFHNDIKMDELEVQDPSKLWSDSLALKSNVLEDFDSGEDFDPTPADEGSTLRYRGVLKKSKTRSSPKKRVSWGENSYHQTHSGDDYDRTSFPDPYEDDEDFDYEDSFGEKSSSTKFSIKPVGVSIIVLYFAMLIMLATPSML
eukprot:CAMPEP_0167760388 /NCGR_PEP_ID=MMETSP0110_2-20121227/11561_1 /TAXON_ID=629695 /ORGANISM="Gymnochlora sp., Strain CCMP2014" /LENGTH=232 /DNA_ID=CAMNT_0007646899 /DNA_START=202 /DNA_END=900 /DNA_ORIENTATION=+